MIGIVKLWKWLVKTIEAYTVQVPYTTTENIIITVNPGKTSIYGNDALIANASPARSDVYIAITWSGYRNGNFVSETTVVSCSNNITNIGAASGVIISSWSVTSGGTKINNTQIRCNATQTVTRYRTETRYREVSEWFHR